MKSSEKISKDRYISSEMKLPHPALARWISHYWSISGDFEPADRNVNQTLYPGCGCAIVFQLKEQVDVLSAKNEWTDRPIGIVEGQFLKPLQLRFAGRFHQVGISFMPGQIPTFLRASQAEINEQFIDIRLVFGSEGALLLEQVATAATFQEIVDIFDKFFLAHMPSNWNNCPVQNFISLAISSQGELSVREMAQECSISVRQLERKFHDLIGFSPKVFSRTIRFNAFLNLMQMKSSVACLRTLAHECGYFDQAHLIHDFRHFTGETPLEYFGSGHLVGSVLTENHARAQNIL